MSAIHLKNLTKTFGDFTALKTMDLEIADGEFMALLGPSGCGKSTTMNMIAGMEEPSSGKILFGERDMAGVPMGRRGVGFVFQNYAIFTHMTVRQNLAYGPRMRGAAKVEIDRRVGAIAEMLQLSPLLDRKADRLSVNILQRVAIGRSAIMEPAIFLLDEPLSNVDAAFRAVMRTELKPAVEKRIGSLWSLANIATLIGLLGTITGLIGAFAAVAKAAAADRSTILSAKISEAMNNTWLGLAIAVTCMIAACCLYLGFVVVRHLFF